MAEHKLCVVRAKRLLVLRHYKQAIDVCREGLEHSRKSSSDRARALLQSALVIIAVQAHAEMDDWRQGVAFAISTFGSNAELPVEVAQVCMSLYIKAQQFDLERDLVEQWLRNSDNCCQPKHRNMMAFHIRCVVQQQEDFTGATQFIEQHSLDENEEKHLQDIVKTMEEGQSEHILQQKSCILQNNAASWDRVPVNSNRASAAVSFHHGLLIRMSILMEKLRSLGARLGGSKMCAQLGRLLFLVFFLFAALTASSSQGFLSKGSGVSVLYQAALQAWRALFAPYHLMSLRNQ